MEWGKNKSEPGRPSRKYMQKSWLKWWWSRLEVIIAGWRQTDEREIFKGIICSLLMDWIWGVQGRKGWLLTKAKTQMKVPFTQGKLGREPVKGMKELFYVHLSHSNRSSSYENLSTLTTYTSKFSTWLPNQYYTHWLSIVFWKPENLLLKMSAFK